MFLNASVGVRLIQPYLLLKPSLCYLLVSKNKPVKETVIVVSISLLPSYHIATVHQLVPVKIIRRYAYYILCCILHISQVTKFYNHISTKINNNMNTTRMHSNKLVYL
jgi:uncharacterized membrane protein